MLLGHDNEDEQPRKIQKLKDDDYFYMSEANRQNYERCRAQLNAHLQGEIDRITAITTMKMENEAAKTGYAQQEVRDAYGANVSPYSHGSGSQGYCF